jgi:hypothetical protein
VAALDLSGALLGILAAAAFIFALGSAAYFVERRKK